MDLRHINPETFKLIDWNKVLQEREDKYGNKNKDALELQQNVDGITAQKKSINPGPRETTVKRVEFNLENNNSQTNSNNKSSIRILSGRKVSANKNPASSYRVRQVPRIPRSESPTPVSKLSTSDPATTTKYFSKKIDQDLPPEEMPTSTYLQAPVNYFARKKKSSVYVEEKKSSSSTISRPTKDFNGNFPQTSLIVFTSILEESNEDDDVNSGGDPPPPAVQNQNQTPQVSILKHSGGDVKPDPVAVSLSPEPPASEIKKPVIQQIQTQSNHWNISPCSVQYLKKLYMLLLFLLIGSGIQLLALAKYEIQFMKTGLKESFVGYETWIQYITGLLAILIGTSSIYITVNDCYKCIIYLIIPGAGVLLILNIISIASIGIQYQDVDNYIHNFFEKSPKDLESKDWKILDYIQFEFNCCGGQNGYKDYQMDQLPSSCCFQIVNPDSNNTITTPNCTKSNYELGIIKEASCSKLVQEYVKLMSSNAGIILVYITIVIILFLVIGTLYARALAKDWKRYEHRFIEQKKESEKKT